MGLAWGIRQNVNWWDFFWITVAMGAARTSAMSLNRYIDRTIDANNPRTANRPIQTRAIKASTVLLFSLTSLVILALAAWMLNPLAFFLFPGALIFLVGYSYTKRFTWLSHYILGFTDGLAPMGAWVGVTGTLTNFTDIPAWLLLAMVTVWIGGFDIIYACQDVEFDRKSGLYSIPAIFGIKASLRVAAASHILTIMLAVLLGLTTKLLWPYWIGVSIMAILLFYENALVRPDDLSKINIAFFNINGYISITFFLGILVALLIA
jgi:4-hydroxybenzoate polyprenyltransferase